MAHFLKVQMWFWIIVLTSLIPIFFLYRFWFFLRNPKRKIPEGNNIVAPADGFVLYIKEIIDGRVPLSVKNRKEIYLKELMDGSETNYNLVIGIFMTPFSVHYNRFPFAGDVKKIFYRSAKENKSMISVFLNLLFNLKPLTAGADYILENERNTMVLKGNNIDGAVVQIATKWVDTIKNNLYRVGDKVSKGEKFGMIRMGSQCDLFLNIKGDYKVLVKERDYVKAGSSVLIELEKKK